MRRMVVVPIAALLFAGCSCEPPPGPTGAHGELKVEENQIEFGEACPKPSDPELTVETVTRQVHIRNEGAAELYINKFEVDRADVFTFDPAQVPETLPLGGEAAIEITFTPKESGMVVADLTIVGDEKQVVVKLLGTGKSLPAHPRLSMSCPGGAFEGDGCATETPNLFFKATPIGQSNEMTVTLKNGGCPTLVVKQITVTSDVEEGADPDTFKLADDEPAELTIAGGATKTIKVRFSPSLSGVFTGALTFTTNDPERKTLSLDLKGAGTEPVLAVETAIGCGFPDPSARPYCCDFKPKGTACNGKFTVRNTGEEPLTITAVYIQNSNPMFQLDESSSIVGAEIPGLGELKDAITVNYVPSAYAESDFLIVESSGGNAQAELRGGSPAFLETFPVGILNFGTGLEVTEDYWMPVQVMNKLKYNQQLPLTIGGLQISQAAGVPAFELSATAQGDCTPTLTEGDTIPAGESRNLCVHFKSAVNGGSFSGMLTIESDDPNYPESSGWYRLSLAAEAKCNPQPEAEVSVPLSESCPCNATTPPSVCVGNTCHADTSPYEVVTTSGGSLVLSGEQSHDLIPGGDGQCTVKDYAGVKSFAWQLLSKPTGSSATLTQDASNAHLATLTYDRAGPYIVELKVTDQTDLESAATTFTVTVRSSN
ncbi:MAG: choice-of-anchor D domain-containing protein [Myxococcales bacterium]|jgi:hypothetical protein